MVVFDVMEHLTDPIQTLAALGAFLKPGGILLIETGNTDSTGFRKAGPRYAYAGIVEHVGFFNESSIRRAGRQAQLGRVHFEISQHSRMNPHGRFGFCPAHTVYTALSLPGVAALP